MATVYLAIQENFQREVALKVMSPVLSESGDFSERFLREARIVSRLVHPHIVTVHDVGIQNGHHYLSMEYIEGEDLKDRLPGLDGEQRLRVLSEVAGALDYAGRKGYVHRDVKPENIMLYKQGGRSILMDFGIARAADSVSTMTRTGTALGTPHYMSPEQARGKAIDGRSDLYSLGVLLYYMLTGEVPYDADSPVAVGIKHVSADLPQLPAPLAEYQFLIDKLMAKNADDRYQTGSELVAALTSVDGTAFDLWQSKKANDYSSNKSHTPLRSDRVQSVGAGKFANKQPVGTAGSAVGESGFDHLVTGSHPQDALHIPREDLDARRVKHKGNGWLFILPVVVIALLAAAYYAYSSGKLVLPAVVANVLSLESVLTDRQLARSKAGASGTQPSPELSASGLERGENDTNSSVLGDELTGESVEELLRRSDQLVSIRNRSPGQTTALLGIYRQILLLEPGHPVVVERLDELQQEVLAGVAGALERQSLDSARLSLDRALEWFPELNGDERFQQLDQRYEHEQRIIELLSLADTQLSSNRLLRPEGDNAKATYDQVLQLDASNTAAKSGIEKIVSRYGQLASSSFKRQDYDKTRQFIESGLSIDPDNKSLLALAESLAAKQQLQQQVNTLLEEASSLERQQRWFGQGNSAVEKYLQVLALDAGQSQANQALVSIVEDFSAEIDGLIAIRDYELATARVGQALQSLPSNTQLQQLMLQLQSLAPAISQLTISGSPITASVKPLARRIKADRTMYITFQFSNLEQSTTVFQGVLFDGGRSVQIAGVPVVVVGDEGVARFSINRPVESFTDGGYHLDILLAGEQIFSHSFVIENN